MNYWLVTNLIFSVLIGGCKTIIDIRWFAPEKLPDTPWWRKKGKRIFLLPFICNDAFHWAWVILLFSVGLCSITARMAESYWVALDGVVAGLAFIAGFHGYFKMPIKTQEETT